MIFAAFWTGVDGPCGDEGAVRMRVRSSWKRLEEASSVSDYCSAARGAGLYYSWAVDRGEPNDISDALALLYRVTLDSWEPDGDSLCDMIAKTAITSAEWFSGNGRPREAAIQLTAAATAVGQKCNITDEDINIARAAVGESFKLKTRGTADWAYSVFASATIEERVTNDAATLTRARKQIARSLSRISGAVTEDDLLTGHMLAVKLEKRIFEAKVREHQRDLKLAARAKLDEIALAWPPVDQDVLYELLQDNPQLLGFTEAPPWVISEADVRCQIRSERRHCADVARADLMAVAERFPELYSRRKKDVDRAIAELSWLLEPSLDTFKSAVSFLGDPDEAGDLSSYFKDALTMAHEWTSIESNDPAPIELLRGIARAHQRFLATDMVSEEFVRDLNILAVPIRFVACALARHSAWKEALDLGALARQMLESSSLPTAAGGVARVHVTHDPFASFVIVQDPRDGRVCGRQVDLRGRDLLVHWFAMTSETPGMELMKMTGHGQAAYAQGFRAMCDDLQPLTSAILELTDGVEMLALETCGLYYRAPLAALIEAAAPGRYSAIGRYFSPTTSNDNSRSAGSSVLSADEVEGRTSLPVSRAEAQNVADLIGVEPIVDATPGQLIEAFRQSAHVHFAGHSHASVENALENSLVTSSGTLSAAELLTAGTFSATLVFLNACESSLNAALAFSDQVLTIDGVLARQGCSVVIGCVAPVLETPAGLLAARFYQLLMSVESLSVVRIYRALADTQLWARESNSAELESFNRKLARPYALSAQFLSEEHPLAHPRCWAPYQLSVSRDAER